jgi:hypothetical protein
MFKSNKSDLGQRGQKGIFLRKFLKTKGSIDFLFFAGSLKISCNSRRFSGK